MLKLNSNRWFTLLILACACANSQARTVAQPSLARPTSASKSALSPPAGGAGAPQVGSAVVDLWPQGVPDALPDAPPERVADGRVYNVSRPTLGVFRPPTATANGTAVIVCPGGGYLRLAMNNEGSDVTRWFNSIGVTAFVLKYRVDPYRYPSALRDVLRALRWVRAHATELGVDPRRVGVFGSSAGGHVALSAATLFDAPEGQVASSMDSVDARPDFVALLYPVVTMQPPFAHLGSRRALLGEHPSDELSSRTSLELRVTARTPPTFIVHSAEDASVPVENSLMLERALTRAHIPVELHVFAVGPHGFGMRPGLGTTSLWPERLADWLRMRDFLPPSSAVLAQQR